MTFPSAGSVVYYNDAGEPIGWDAPSYYDTEPYDPDEWYESHAWDDDEDEDEDEETTYSEPTYQ